MNARLIIFAILFFSFNVYGQNPMIVEDLMLGPLSGVQIDNFHDGYLKEGYVYVGRSNNYGTELYVIKNNEINLLKDFTEGPNSSNIKILERVENHLFLTVDGSTLWKTDGTEEGTKLVVPSGTTNSVEVLAVSDFNDVYVTRNGSLYKLEEQGVTLIPSPNIVFSENDNGGSNFSNYLDGIAYISINSDFVDNEPVNIVMVFYIENGSIITLGEFPLMDFSFDYSISHMHRFDGGLFFTITDDQSENHPGNGLYVYNESESNIYMINERDVGASIAIDDDVSLYLIDDVLHKFSSEHPIGIEYSNDIFVVNDSNNYELLFHATDENSVLLRGTESGLDFSLITAENDQLVVDYSIEGASFASVEIKGDLIFYWTGLESIELPTINVYDVKEDSHSTLFIWDGNSIDPSGPLSPICALDNKYYFSYETSSLGREIYSVDIGINTSIFKLIDGLQLELVQLGNGVFNIIGEGNENYQIDVFDLHGRKLESLSSKSEQDFNVRRYGSMILVAIQNGKRQLRLFKVLNL